MLSLILFSIHPGTVIFEKGEMVLCLPHIHDASWPAPIPEPQTVLTLRVLVHSALWDVRSRPDANLPSAPGLPGCLSSR